MTWANPSINAAQTLRPPQPQLRTCNAKYSASPRQASISPSRVPSPMSSFSSPSTRTRSAAWYSSNSDTKPTAARSRRAAATAWPGVLAGPVHGCPSAASPARMRCRQLGRLMDAGASFAAAKAASNAPVQVAGAEPPRRGWRSGRGGWFWTCGHPRQEQRCRHDRVAGDTWFPIPGLNEPVGTRPPRTARRRSANGLPAGVAPGKDDAGWQAYTAFSLRVGNPGHLAEGGDSSCAGEIPACQSFVSMASGDLKGKMNYRVWPVSSSAKPETTVRAVPQPTIHPAVPSLSHRPSRLTT